MRTASPIDTPITTRCITTEYMWIGECNHRLIAQARLRTIISHEKRERYPGAHGTDRAEKRRTENTAKMRRNGQNTGGDQRYDVRSVVDQHNAQV
jgi:hypothetical protein